MSNLDVELGVGCHPISENSIKVDKGHKVPCVKATVDVVADIEHLPFRDDVFNQAFLFEVLEHTDSPLETLKEACRVAESVLISVPNPYYFMDLLRFIIPAPSQIFALYRWLRHRNSFTYHKHIPTASDHLYAWTIGEMRCLLTKAGFNINYISYSTTHHFSRHILTELFPRVTNRSLVVGASREG